jgi:glycosyltransferase involved in cell wall biosynthesis
LTLEAEARHPKVLIISQGAPGVGKDANSIMLRRLLTSFPEDSYVVLASSRNWPDGCVPQEQSGSGYRCFHNSLRKVGSRGNEGESSPGMQHTRRWKVLIPAGVRRWLRRAFLRTVLDPVALIEQTRSAAAEAVSLVRSEAITSILAVSDYGPCFVGGWIAHRRTGVPLDLFIFDLWRDGVLPWSQGLMALLFQHRVFAASRYVFAAGRGICKRLDDQLGVKSVVIPNSVIAHSTATSCQPRSGSPLIVVYTGGVYWAQLDAILDLIAAIRDMVGVEFHIYSHGQQDELRAMGVDGSNVVFHQGLAEQEVSVRQAAADVLYLPMSFGREGRLIIETAQPAKSVEYMASGVPVLVHAPAYAFVARYAREHDIAVVVDQPGPDELRRALAALMSDRTDARAKAQRAAELAGQMYDSLKVSRLLQSYLLHECETG